MGFIYKITNKINNKAYIGQTTRDIQTRWAEHIRCAFYPNLDYTSYLYNAIRKYGTDAFSIELIEECSDSILDEREQYWIKEFDSCEIGYNITRGGQGAIRCNKEDIVELWERGYAVKEIATMLNYSKQAVAKHLKYNGITKFDILSRGNKLSSCRKRKVIQISLDGKKYRIFNSLSDAAEKTNSSLSQISMACSGKRKTANGYRWEYYNDESPLTSYNPLTSEYRIHKKEVHQYSIDGKYIRSFESMSSAARSVGKKSIRTIDNACKSKTHYGYGYLWSFEKYNILPKFENSKIA